MNVLWIIGNGFDLNLDLKIGMNFFVESIHYWEEMHKKLDGNVITKGKYEDRKRTWDNDEWVKMEMKAGALTQDKE